MLVYSTVRESKETNLSAQKTTVLGQLVLGIDLILEHFLHFVFDVLAILLGSRDESSENEMRKEVSSDGDVLETENRWESAEDFFGDRSLEHFDQLGRPASNPVAVGEGMSVDGIRRERGRRSILERERRPEKRTASFENEFRQKIPTIPYSRRHHLRSSRRK